MSSQPSSSANLTRGEVVASRYEIIRELGRGGMGVVYLCLDLATGDRVALKCVFVEKTRSQPSDVIWFQQEARALAALDHPAIVRARDFGTLDDGSPYLVMDAHQGRSIHVWKYLTKIPWVATWSIIDQVLAGLAHAHARGVIHGDLKPSNILVDPRDGREELRTVVLDLGLAWLLSDHVDQRLLPNEIAEVALPFGLGTPGWMAPEQIRRAAPHIGPPTDLYALGSILYEMLSGREVFTGNGQDILRNHRDTPVTDVHMAPEVPEGVRGFVLKMLEKKPWHRFLYAADAREHWHEFKPTVPLLWAAPKVRVGDAHSDAALYSTRPPTLDPKVATGLAPGILSLRPAPLIGREQEQQTLLDVARDVGEAIDEQNGRHQQAVVLTGRAGLGKSRLCEWLCENVHERGVMIPLRARYARVPGPFDGLRGAVMAHYNVRGQSRDVIEQALLNEWDVTPEDENGRTWVAATAQWLNPPLAGEQDKVGPSGKRFYLDKPELRWVIIRHVLERIGADGRPLLLWLDDVHHASQTAIAGVQQLLREMPQLAILLLITARDEALSADVPTAVRLASLERSIPSTRVQLLPLSDEGMRAMVRASLRLAPEAEEEVLQRSRGNPLFALQLVNGWASAGMLHLEGSVYRVPQEALEHRASTTEELWEERLAMIEGSLRPAAYAAAALGEVMSMGALSRLLRTIGIDSPSALRALQQAEMLLSEGGVRFRFSHALLQEHLFTKLSSLPDATRIFRAAAETLAAQHDAASRPVMRQRATNLLLAGDADEAASVVFEHTQRTWSQIRDVPATKADLDLLEGHVDGLSLARLRYWRAETERLLGDLDAARTQAELARQGFDEAGREADEAQVLRLLAHIASDQGAPALGRIEAVLAVAKFEALGDDVGKAQCDLLLGEILYLLGEHALAREALRRAGTTHRKQGDLLRLGQGLILRSLVEQAAHRIDLARDLLQQARKAFDELGYQLGLAQVDVIYGHVEHRASRLEAAYQLAARTVERFRALSNPRGEAACERLAAMASMDAGQLERALRHALSTYELFDKRIDDPWGRVEGLVLVAQVMLLSGLLDQAAVRLTQSFDVAVDEAEPVQHRHLTAAWLALRNTRPHEAATHIRKAREAFGGERRTGDHTAFLLTQLAREARGTMAEAPLEDWQRWLEGGTSRGSAPPSTHPPPPPA